VGVGGRLAETVDGTRTVTKIRAIAAKWAENDGICRLALLLLLSSSMLNISDFLSAV
jgi:hypothetical protein